jgi:hypothetical protein
VIGTAEKRNRAAWSADVRSRAEELARDFNATASDVRVALQEELGATVALSTVGRWLADVRRREGVNRPALLRSIGDRAACLLSAELDRLERQTGAKRDLARIDAVVRTLKTLSSVETGKTGGGRQTLADLQTGATEPDRDEVPMHRAA